MECLTLTSTSYSAFSERLHARALRERLPLNGSLELTPRCNLGCVHCYINRPAADRETQRAELRTDEVKRIIAEITAAGCLWLLITGGEPLLRADFLELYTHAKRAGLIVTLFSNGTLITPHLADQLAEWPPFAVEITLYGHTQATYERVTGVPGSFTQCRRGIDLLLARKIPLSLKSIAITLNRYEIDAMEDFARSLGVEYRYDPVLNMRLDGDRTPASYQIPVDDIVTMETGDERRRAALQDMFRKMVKPPTRSDQLFVCGAGWNSFHIDAFGRLSICSMARQTSFDLRQGTFREGWDHFLPTVRAQKRTRPSPCQTCELLSVCSQCPGAAQLDSGDPEAHIGFACQLTHARASVFGPRSR